MSEPSAQSKFWLDQAADEAVKRHPKGELVVSSGISPSASYHIGHFREIMTAEALAWALRQRGRTVRHLHVVDNFDPLRKWYDFLPPAERDYSGWPIALVPDPYGGCHASYADHFFAEFEQHLAPMGIEPEIVRSYENLYQPGHMVKYIELALEKVDEIKKIFQRLSNRELPENWTPVMVLGEDGRFEKGQLSTWDQKAQTLNGRSYAAGGAKLDWRLDWPARWAYLKVDVEPFGAQEHGAAGGSYQTGAEFCRQVFGAEPPFDAARYGHIHLVGETVKMSSSKGNGVTPGEALKIMPPEILRYFMVRSRPDKKLFFDPGLGLYNLIDEFAAAQADPQHPFRDAYEFAVAGAGKDKSGHIISSVSFKHLVQVYQAARGDERETLRVLERTGYEHQVKTEREVIVAELPFVANWLAAHAPEEVRFSLQAKLPAVALTDQQQRFLSTLAETIETHAREIDGQAMHELIYAAREQADLSAAAAFQAIYQVILGKTHGPKAGWFLASLERDWLIGRLRLER